MRFGLLPSFFSFIHSFIPCFDLRLHPCSSFVSIYPPATSRSELHDFWFLFFEFLSLRFQIFRSPRTSKGHCDEEGEDESGFCINLMMNTKGDDGGRNSPSLVPHWVESFPTRSPHQEWHHCHCHQNDALCWCRQSNRHRCAWGWHSWYDASLRLLLSTSGQERWDYKLETRGKWEAALKERKKQITYRELSHPSSWQMQLECWCSEYPTSWEITDYVTLVPEWCHKSNLDF